jgi:hypothetical protein
MDASGKIETDRVDADDPGRVPKSAELKGQRLPLLRAAWGERPQLK